MTEVSLRKLAVQVSKRTHVLCVSNQCSQERVGNRFLAQKHLEDGE